MNRSIRILLGIVIAVLAAAPAPASAAPALRNATVIDDLGLPLRSWSVNGSPGLGQLTFRGGPGLSGVYATKARALRLTPGGSIARSLPQRPWSLSLDVRLARGSSLRIDLGGAPLDLRKRSDGKLAIASGGSGATLRSNSARPGGWHHIELAGFDPAELHVDGTRIPHEIVQGTRIRLRALRGSAQLTGLVATRRDDRRALLLHRVAAIHSLTAQRRFPVRTTPDGVLRFEKGRYDGFYAGSLWNAYGLTGARLFFGWGERATFDQFSLNEFRKPPVHWQGLRFNESMANADQRTCEVPEPRQHRCRLLRKGSSSVGIYGMSNGNPGNWAIPSVLWPRRCPSCASSDEVEIRIETMMDTGVMEWSHTLHEAYRAAHPNLRIDPGPLGPRSIEHAGVVARLLVRDDGSTAEGVRTNRLDGTVLSYEGGNGIGPDTTWARGHAGAIYGFARTGLRFERPELVAVADRAARYLEANLPASRIPPHDFGAPDGPADPEAGALYAAGLLRLAEACERLASACAGGPRWRALGTAMLDALLGRLNAHPPLGYAPEGDTLMGIDFALEAVERAAP